MKRGSTQVSLMFLLAVLVASAGSIISIISFPALPRQGDSFQYLVAARWVLGEAEFTGAYHPAGYPVFLAALIRAGGTAFGPLLVFAQHLVRLLPLVLFWWLGRSREDRRLAGVAALVWACAPEGLVFAHVVMAESVATGLAAVVVMAVLAHAERPSPRRGLVAGALVGVLALFKSAGGAWLVPVLLVRPGSRRAGRWPLVLAALAGFAVVSGASAVAQRAKAGFWIVPASPGVHLFSRVVSEDGALPPGDEGLAALNAMVARPRSAPATAVWNYDRTLEALGVPAGERRRIFLGLALRGLARDPVGYLAGTARGCAELVAWSPKPPAGASAYRAGEYRLAVPRSLDDAVADLAPRVPDPGALDWMLVQLGAVFDPGAATSVLSAWVMGWRALLGWLRWPLVGLVVLGILSAWRARHGSSRSRIVCVCLLLWLAGHAAMEMAVPRYGLPVQPLVALCACTGAVWLHGAFAKMAARR